MPAVVSETFFAVSVRDMDRAAAFYVAAFGAAVAFQSDEWSSLVIAGVRVGLALVSDEEALVPTGLHFAVKDRAEACAAVERAGGTVIVKQIEPGGGVVLATVADTEGNRIVLVGP
jgi:predicted enzyme related to lactoylglutathione lyase